ncbi:MAG: 3-deoxy-manno-octulosonate cytidylyltransferase [Bacteroidetes bacterium]|nr:3-deoxy-manno-octulosonate cytidylyltransferase [Bacteroidota bacterium]
MKIIAIIPSRYASTRLPAKPLADICGKPMVQHVVEQAKRSALITDVIVATDDERIAAAVRAFGGTAVMTPEEIQSGSDRIALVAKERPADIIVNIQGDEPLIDPLLIDQTIRALIDDPKAVVSTAVKRTTAHQDIFNPNVVKVAMDAHGYALYFSRSPIPHVRDVRKDDDWFKGTVFYKHFGIYVYRAAFLQQYTQLPQTPLESAEKLEQLRILEHGHSIKCVVTEYESHPVDTPEDLQKVIHILQSR